MVWEDDVAEPADLVKLYGTDERVEAMRLVEIGGLSFLLDRRRSAVSVGTVWSLCGRSPGRSAIRAGSRSFPRSWMNHFAEQGDSAVYDLRFTAGGGARLPFDRAG